MAVALPAKFFSKRVVRKRLFFLHQPLNKNGTCLSSGRHVPFALKGRRKHIYRDVSKTSLRRRNNGIETSLSESRYIFNNTVPLRVCMLFGFCTLEYLITYAYAPCIHIIPLYLPSHDLLMSVLSYIISPVRVYI